MVVIESSDPEHHGTKVAGLCGKSASVITLSQTMHLPEGPAMVKIESEWIEYEDLSSTQLLRVRRGKRGTRAATHAADAPVHFGETFTMEVYLAAYREAQEP